MKEKNVKSAAKIFYFNFRMMSMLSNISKLDKVG